MATSSTNPIFQLLHRSSSAASILAQQPTPPPSLLTPLKTCRCESVFSLSPAAPTFQFNHQRRRRQILASVAFNPQGNYDLSLLDDDEVSDKIPQAMPPTEGRIEVFLDNDVIRRLDLTPFQSATGITSSLSVDPKEFLERTIGFTIDYTREDAYDRRELSELPDVRLWFVRLDAEYPWLPVLLDWRAGELARYAAMLVPHQMSTRMGIVFNPEALELFVMNKVFTVYSWLKENSIPKPRLKTGDMARMLGFGIGEELFDLIDKHPTLPS